MVQIEKSLGREAVLEAQQGLQQGPKLDSEKLKQLGIEPGAFLHNGDFVLIGATRDFLFATVTDQNRFQLRQNLSAISYMASVIPFGREGILSTVLAEASQQPVGSQAQLRAAEITAVLDRDMKFARDWSRHIDSNLIEEEQNKGQTVVLLAKTALEYSLLDSSQETELIKATGEHISSSLESLKDIPLGYAKAIFGFVRVASEKKLINETGLTPKQTVEFITKVNEEIPAMECLSILASLNKEESKIGIKATLQENKELEKQTLKLLTRILKQCSFRPPSAEGWQELSDVISLLPEGKTETAKVLLKGMFDILSKSGVIRVKEKSDLEKIATYLKTTSFYLNSSLKPEEVVDGSLLKSYSGLISYFSGWGEEYPLINYFNNYMKSPLDAFMSKASEEIWLNVLPELISPEAQKDRLARYAYRLLLNRPEILWRTIDKEPVWLKLYRANNSEDRKVMLTSMMSISEGDQRAGLVEYLGVEFAEDAMSVFTQKDYLSDKQLGIVGNVIQAIAETKPLAIIFRADLLAEMSVDGQIIENAANSFYRKIQTTRTLSGIEIKAMKNLPSAIYSKIVLNILGDPTITTEIKTQIVIEDQKFLSSCSIEDLEKILAEGIPTTITFSAGERVFIDLLLDKRRFADMIRVEKNGTVRSRDLVLQGLLEASPEELQRYKKDIRAIINRWREDLELGGKIESYQATMVQQIMKRNLASESTKKRLKRLLKKTEVKKK